MYENTRLKKQKGFNICDISYTNELQKIINPHNDRSKAEFINISININQRFFQHGRHAKVISIFNRDSGSVITGARYILQIRTILHLGWLKLIGSDRRVKRFEIVRVDAQIPKLSCPLPMSSGDLAAARYITKTERTFRIAPGARLSRRICTWKDERASEKIYFQREKKNERESTPVAGKSRERNPKICFLSSIYRSIPIRAPA